MLLHISRSAAEQALWLVQADASAKYSDEILEDLVKDHFKCDVLVYKDTYVDDFAFGRRVECYLNNQKSFQHISMSIGNIQGTFIPFAKTATIS